MSGKWKRKALLTAGIIILVLGLLIQGTARKNGKEKSTGGRIMEGLAEAAMERALADSCLLPFFLEQGQGTLEDDSPAGKAVEEMFPLYTYTFHEVQEGEDEDQKNIDEENLDYGEGALHIDSDLIARMQQENDGYQENPDHRENLSRMMAWMRRKHLNLRHFRRIPMTGLRNGIMRSWFRTFMP